MKRSFQLLALILATGVCRAETTVPDDPAGRALIQEAERVIAAWHAGQPPAHHALRVIYFIPKDGEPLPGYAERLDRVMNDVSDYYRDGLRRFGIETTGLPLERTNGQLVLHLVRGKLPAAKYTYDSGDDTAKEIRTALKGTMDLDREVSLVFYALCRRETDGRYVFNAPYYGGGSQAAGICHAADCELLDPLLLTATNRRIVFTEHYYPRNETSVARFNSMYLGGTAHELGHALGLPHDNGGEAEKSSGISLMGGGNLNYREELWGGGPPAYLSRATALQLASHPFFTGSDRGRWDDAQSRFKSLDFSATNNTLTVRGAVTGKIPCYAVVAYAWPSGGSQDDDHSAITFPCLVRDGAFAVNLDGLPPGKWHLNLSRLHVNGAAFSQEYPVGYDAATPPDARKSCWTVAGKRVLLLPGSDVAAVKADWLVNRSEIAVMHGQADAQKLVNDEAIASVNSSDAARKLRLLHAVLNPVAPMDLAAITNDSAFLSDVNWTDAKVGWGQVARNYFWFDKNNQDGVFLLLGGEFFDKGLYAHSSSRFVFPVDAKWKTFTATVGLRDGALAEGSAVFTVRGDGRELYRSRMLRAGDREDIKVDISQVRELELLADGGEGHNHHSWAIWAAPKIQR